MAGNLAAVAETRREWLRSCSSPSAGPSQNQGTNNLERQQLAPPSSPPGLSRLPSPAPKSAVMRAKKAAPPAKAKAADGAY
jgi:hypothetical protein